MIGLVLLNLPALEVRTLESFVVATVFIWDFMLEVSHRRVRFPPCTISAYLGRIQRKMNPLTEG